MRADAYLLGDKQSGSASNVSGQKPFVKSGLATAVNRGLSNLVTRLAGNPEPQIWQTRDRQGDLIWHVYDPMNNQSSVFQSEMEVRVWLDQRYNG